MFFRRLIERWKARRIQRQRLLFRLWDGRRFIKIDPYRVWRDFQNDPEANLETMGALVDAGHEPETTIVLEAIARAFDVSRYDPQTDTGLADWELLNLLFSLNLYIDNLKKKYVLGPILPPSSELPPSTSPEAQDEATKPS